MSKWRPPAEWRHCADCGRRFQVARRDSLAQRCIKHRHKNPGGWLSRPKKYPNTEFSDRLIRERYDGKVYGRAAEIAAQLGWPGWAVKKRAAALGVTQAWPRDRKDWTEEEVKFVREWTGIRYVAWIARKLKRSLTSVVLKQKRLKLSRRVKEGYSLSTLELCFGLDHRPIQGWVDAGLLRIERGISCGKTRRWKVSETAVFEFIWNHPTAFRLDKVDQPWFMDLMKRSLQAALEAQRQTETRRLA